MGESSAQFVDIVAQLERLVPVLTAHARLHERCDLEQVVQLGVLGEGVRVVRPMATRRERVTGEGVAFGAHGWDGCENGVDVRGDAAHLD